jgi:hypothetical protein
VWLRGLANDVHPGLAALAGGFISYADGRLLLLNDGGLVDDRVVGMGSRCAQRQRTDRDGARSDDQLTVATTVMGFTRMLSSRTVAVAAALPI